MKHYTRVNLPQHVAIIMDGNGRWAQSRGLPRIEGHRAGVRSTEEIITAAREMGISHLTLYAFSKENWNRPKQEVNALMELLRIFLLEKRQKMIDNGISLNTIGDKALLPARVRKTLETVIKDTERGQDMVLTLALSYGARDEIVRAINRLIHDRSHSNFSEELITEELFARYLDTVKLPDPDLIIRTSGEMRISNFLLWQGAYAEYVFESCPWPDYTRQHFEAAIKEFQQRERRFGKTVSQVMIA